jgi:type II restriction/modification system DNA methylase subunit YeeA
MESALSPQEFVERWKNTELGERQSYQAHFMDLCRLMGYETPTGTGKDSHGNDFVFEPSLKKQSGGQGFADVFLQNHFAFEYKAANKYKDLRAAYDQLLQYREQLQNPPLLVVTDIHNWEIHTNWPSTEKKIYSFTLEEIATRTVVQDYLRHLFYDPQKLHPRRNSEQVTTEAAKAFELIANNMRDWQAEPQRIANFLTKLVFCLFAEDVSLLPTGSRDEIGIFAEIVERTRHDSKLFVQYAAELFEAMANGGNVLYKSIPYFNGSLFEDVRVEELTFEALAGLERASRLNWESVEPAIFGTLFERSLDPAKRSQLGAHYTSREDILLIVEPVLMRPLERQWEAIKAEATPIRAQYDEALQTSNRRQQTTLAAKLEELRETMLHSLREIKVLDPACGSGNFLYVALQRLMDMEKAVIFDPLFEGLTRPFPEVHPRQMYGIEKDPIAHSLASIVVWIGYLQWRRTNGYLSHPKEPILQNIQANIQNMDAILSYSPLPDSQALESPSLRTGETQEAFESPSLRSGEGFREGIKGIPCEPEWPAVDVIIGNPPFLGRYKQRGELGDEYVDSLFTLYAKRVPADADLVCYWFEKARKQITAGKAKRAGLLATNSIRGGKNREVLNRIKETGDIFMAWADREWVLDGASVRVSMIAFDNGDEKEKILDGGLVTQINPDLTGSVDITIAKQIPENAGLVFQGPVKVGAFDFGWDVAKKLLDSQNIAGLSNTDVLIPYMNGNDMTGRNRNYWIIDFGNRSETEAMRYEKPFQYVVENVKPSRITNNDAQRRTNWWRLGRSGEEYRTAIKPLHRQLFTVAVAKHRLFEWYPTNVLPSNALFAIARDDDYFFGVLHSKLHELWSLRMGTSLEDRPRYTPTTTFETFPFPFVPGKEDTSNAAYLAIAAAAKQLHEEREAWLNPSFPLRSGGTEGGIKDRTLTNLYNALNVFRGTEKMKIKEAAGNFAPRLAELHDTLDKAVCDAYGWPHDILQDEEAILSRLLALNLERAVK